MAKILRAFTITLGAHIRWNPGAAGVGGGLATLDSYLWQDAVEAGDRWRVNFATFPGSAVATSAAATLAVSGWRLNDGYRIDIASGIFRVSKHPNPSGYVAPPSAVRLSVDLDGGLSHVV